MPALSPLTSRGGKPRDLRVTAVVGGAAGVISVPGVKVGDEIISVTTLGFTSTTAATAATPTTLGDLTSQFVSPIKVANQIDNTGGTSTANNILVVVYATRDVRA